MAACGTTPCPKQLDDTILDVLAGRRGNEQVEPLVVVADGSVGGNGERDRPSLERRCAILEAALDRAAVPPELASAYLGVSVGAALANGSTAAAGSLFTAAENSMRERKQERRRSQGRPDGSR